MFFILSKTLSFFIFPINLIIIAFVLSHFLKNPILKKRLFRTGLILLLFFTNDFLSNEVLLAWEEPVTPLKEINKTYDIGIVLTGITELKKKPFDRIYFNKGADRIFHTYQLYKKGIIKKILISGGSGNLFDRERKEANLLESILHLFGVPQEDIIIENQSKNTHESADNVHEIIQSNYPTSKLLLITSAFHMKRSRACFETSGLVVDTFSTDFYTHERILNPFALIIPSSQALGRWEKVLKETTGYVMYWIVGYI